jgi:hypothetical protein
MKKPLLAALLILTLAAISYIAYFSLFSVQQPFDRSVFYYDSPHVHKQIIARLQQNSIPYKLDTNNFIQYHSSNESAVREIIRVIEAGAKPQPPYISFTDATYERLFLAHLDDLNIPYTVKKADSTASTIISWQSDYDDKVRLVLQQLFEHKGTSQKPLRIVVSSPRELEILVNLLRTNNIPFRLIKSQAAKVIGNTDEIIEYDWADYQSVQDLWQEALKISRIEINNRDGHK